MAKQVEEIPTPEALIAEAEEVPVKIDLADYVRVMWVLRKKRFSLRQIAAWVSKRLPINVTHTQVLRMMRSRSFVAEGMNPDDLPETDVPLYEDEMKDEIWGEADGAENDEE